MSRLILPLLLVGLLAGCTPMLTLTISTEPAGAKLYRDKEFVGKSPVTMRYKGEELSAVNGYTGLWVARWSDGALRAAALSVERDDEACKQKGAGWEFSGKRNFVFRK